MAYYGLSAPCCCCWRPFSAQHAVGRSWAARAADRLGAREFPSSGISCARRSPPWREHGGAGHRIAGTLYGSLGAGFVAQNAINTVWSIPCVRWPSFWKRYLRSFGVIRLPGSPSTQTTEPSPRPRASMPPRRIASSCLRPTHCGGRPIGHMAVTYALPRASTRPRAQARRPPGGPGPAGQGQLRVIRGSRPRGLTCPALLYPSRCASTPSSGNRRVRHQVPLVRHRGLAARPAPPAPSPELIQVIPNPAEVLPEPVTRQVTTTPGNGGRSATFSDAESLPPAVTRPNTTPSDEIGMHGKEKVYGSIP